MSVSPVPSTARHTRGRAARQLSILAAAACMATASAAGDAAAEMDPADRSAADIVAFATAAAGGDAWRNARTNVMRGHATLCRDGTPDSCVHADDYVMYRDYPRDLTDAHAGTGRFRLDARADGRVLFKASFDGERSYNQDGPLPEDRDRETQESNFGFSAIRFALEDGFSLKRMVDDTVDGHACHFVRVTDPDGGHTLFGIDRDSGAIRYVGWQTPRGWHERLYDDFYVADDSGFVQPGHVRLYYDGLKTGDIRWTEAEIDVALDDALFVLGTP